MKRTRLILLSFLLLPISLVVAQSNAPAPTLTDIQADFDAQKYQDVIKKSQRLLATRSDPTKQPDRAAIENLKGEAQLHLKQFQPAGESFAAAGKDAIEAKDISDYRAMALLVKRSPGGHYTSKPVAGTGEKPEPIDIVETDSRKKAFAALYTDESKLVQKKVDSARQKQALPAIMNLTHEVLDLRAVEIAGTGSDVGTRKMLSEISDQAATLMGDAVRSMTTVVDKIAKTANESYDSSPRNNGYGQGQTVTSKRGLSSTDKKSLEEVIANCKDIEGAAEQLSQGSDDKSAPTTRPAGRAGAAAVGTSMSAVKDQASKLGARADQILNGDYSDRNSNPGAGNGNQQQQQRPAQPPPPRN